MNLDGKTIKIANEQFTTLTDPDHVQRAFSLEEEQSMYKDYVQGRLPGIFNRCAAAASCLYTTTPDSNFFTWITITSSLRRLFTTWIQSLRSDRRGAGGESHRRRK